MNKMLEKLAAIIAARVAEEVIKRLPEITAALIEVLPDIVDAVIDRLLDELPVTSCSSQADMDKVMGRATEGTPVTQEQRIDCDLIFPGPDHR